MIWKFIVSAIALVLVTTGAANAEWVEGRHKATNNPFEDGYGEDYIYAKSYDINGSGSYLRLHRYINAGGTPKVHCNLYVTFDICCEKDGYFGHVLRFAIDGHEKRLGGVVSDDLRNVRLFYWEPRHWLGFRRYAQFPIFEKAYRSFYEGNELWIRIEDTKSKKIRYLQFDISGKPNWSR